MSNKPWRSLLLGVLAVALAAAGCGSSREPSAGSTASGKVVPIRIAVVPASLSELPIYVATDEGLFQKHGLEPQIQTVPSVPNQLALATSGGTDIFVTLPGIAIPARSTGNCVKFIDHGEDQPLDIIVKSDVPTPNSGNPYPGNMRDLKGLKIGLGALGGDSQKLIQKMAAAAGLDPNKDLQFVALGNVPGLVAGFNQGTIQATTAFPPMEELIGKSNYKLLQPLSLGRSPIGEQITGGYAADCSLIQSSPKLISSFCETMQDAYKFLHDPANKDKVVNALAKNIQIQPELASQIWQNWQKSFTGPKITETQWSEALAVANVATPQSAPYKDFTYAPCVG